MFVSDNSVKSVKKYFNERLNSTFSDREIRWMFQLIAQKRLGFSSADLILADSEKMSESDLLFFRSIVKRLLNQEPFQYIYGETEFYGLMIKTDHRALIPRPETEELVDWIVKSNDHSNNQIVDICSGSGCIALALKNEIKSAKVLGLEISEKAIELSTENAQLNNIDVSFLQNDILNDEFPYQDNSIDVIVSNPPYVLENEKIGMQGHVLEFEPHLALFVEDKTPLLFYEKITQIAKDKLLNDGYIYFEINEKYGHEMIQLLKEYDFVNIELKQDLQGKDRMIRGQKKV